MINWKPISEYDFNKAPNVLLAVLITPSEYARQNGANPFWDYAFGRCWDEKSKKFTGILGGTPSHFDEMTPPYDMTQPDGTSI